MRIGLLKLSLVCLVLALGFGPPAAAQQNARAGRAATKCSTPGKFSQYVLALSWAPNFCGSNSGNCSKGECKNLSGTFTGNHLTLHGLWPQYTAAEAPSGCPYPSGCKGPGYNKNALPPEMATLAPGYVLDGLGKHEWPKHGTCSGLSQPNFYQTAVRLMQSLGGDQGSPDAITKNVGGQVALTTLQQAFKDVPAESVALSCDNACNLQQVEICFGADAQGNATTPTACSRFVTETPYDNSCVVGSNGKKTAQQPACPMIKIQAPAGVCAISGKDNAKGKNP